MQSSRKHQAWSNAPYSFLIEECGGDGDCLFHVVANGLSRALDDKVDMMTVRSLLATSVTPETVLDFVKRIGEDHKAFLPIGSIDFNQFHFSHEDDGRNDLTDRVRDIITTSGSLFQGTDECLSWMVQNCEVFLQHKIGFLVMSSFGPDYIARIDNKHTQIYILLFNHANIHWQLSNLVDHPSASVYCSVTGIVCDRLLQISQRDSKKNKTNQ